MYSSPVYTISTLTCNQLTVTANTRVYDYRGLQANIFADPTLFSNSKTIYNGTFTHTLRCAAIVLRCAALRYRCTIASAAQRSDNYLDYRSAAQRMCERTIIPVPSAAHPSTASVLITVLLYIGPLLCGFNVPIKS